MDLRTYYNECNYDTLCLLGRHFCYNINHISNILCECIRNNLLWGKGRKSHYKSTFNEKYVSNLEDNESANCLLMKIIKQCPLILQTYNLSNE